MHITFFGSLGETEEETKREVMQEAAVKAVHRITES